LIRFYAHSNKQIYQKFYIYLKSKTDFQNYTLQQKKIRLANHPPYEKS